MTLSSKIIAIFLLHVQIFRNQAILIFSVAAETRVWKHLFVHNSVRKRARDKSRIPNERVDQAGHFGGLVIDIRPKMTEILMVYRKTLKKIDFFHFFGDNSKTIGDIDTKSVLN